MVLMKATNKDDPGSEGMKVVGWVIGWSEGSPLKDNELLGQ